MNILEAKNYYNLIKVEIIEQAKFTYSPFNKAFEKQIKTIEDLGIKQVAALKALKPEENKEDRKSNKGIFPKDMQTNEIKNEIYEIKKWEEKIKQKDLKYKKNTHMTLSNMKQYFGESVYPRKASIGEAEENQSNLLENLVEFNNRSRP